ncbi:16S rRNA (guanine(966)-N(2))-methyltransferase RsmD [Mycolicibacterium psychrotolerans]|uniref:16S rRNA (Guanine(966)-N(2))-methyltransferase RsmD n=1 Tax=Mycolicibacterium psychrotolerans TaxID=216929 RepID=A0A7I7MHP5_9MYCO|nr:16S rRNA (guanine(966)-N(2))-methyltransferase RsmD [Mycolicibacterium psychrotolerans]
MPQHGTRPTTDRVRESLFNLLAVRIDFTGIDVVDLYAGSGALGLEALSRGARSALFVESDARAAAVIERNIASLGARGATVRRAPVAAVVAGAAGAPADLVLADPPYAVTTGEVTGLVAALADHGWVADGSVVVVERPTSVPQIDWPDGWIAWKARRYGDTRVELAQRA